MSEKFSSEVREKIVDSVILFIFLIIGIPLLIVFSLIPFLLLAFIKGIIVSFCWNVAITTMFEFSKITFFQALILIYTIDSLRYDYLGKAKSDYNDLREKAISLDINEKKANVITVIIVVVVDLISILISVWLTMYTWNNILPQLINVDFVQINFVQALAFSYIFHSLFKKSASTDPNPKEDNHTVMEAEEFPELKAGDNTETEETIQVELVSENEPAV